MDIRDVSLNYLTHRSRTSGEMRKRLSEKGFSEDEISTEMQFLNELHYIDDFEYVRQYAEFCFSKGKGIRRIRNELIQKGVDYVALEELKEIQSEVDLASEQERALLQAEKLIADKKEIDDKLLAKVGRKLAALGYDSETTYQVLGVLMRKKRQDNMD